MKIAAFLTIALAAVWANGQALRVSAAISLRESLSDIAKDYQNTGGAKIDFIYGASGTLATQIAQGAPVDLFISAGSAEIQSLQKEDLLASEPRPICANSLVLIVPTDSTTAIHGFDDLASSAVKRIAIGQPKVVPAGHYAQEVIEHDHLQDALAGRLVLGQNVRQVLEYVEHGEVDAGIVYATDAEQAGKSVHVVATAGDDTHDPIVYPAVIVKGGQTDLARTFLTYLQSPPAQGRLREHGFLPASPATAPAP